MPNTAQLKYVTDERLGLFIRNLVPALVIGDMPEIREKILAKQCGIVEIYRVDYNKLSQIGYFGNYIVLFSRSEIPEYAVLHIVSQIEDVANVLKSIIFD